MFAEPYLQAAKASTVRTPVATIPRVAAKVSGVNGMLYPKTLHLDTGCTINCASRAYMQSNLHKLCGPGSSARLVKLLTPVSVGMFAGQHSSLATHVLQGVQLHIGKGVYAVDLLIIDEGNFDLVLGFSFFADCAVCIWSRDFADRSAGRFLMLLLIQKLCQPGVQQPRPPARHGPHWYPSQLVPLSYQLTVDTWSVVPVADMS